jgi:zinc transport system substrate-binding protein
LVSACASPRAAQESAESATAQVPVSAAFYPLAYLLEQVGGPGVRVWTITKPGVEPHDLELTPKDLVDLPKMSLVAYLKGFQPAVDEAVAQQAPSAAYDVSAAADLTLGAPAGEASATDLHFWLDPIRYAAVGTALGERLALADPTHAADYRARAKTFAASMEQLDKTFATGLASCATKQLVTSHAAFGYLAARYGLTQVPIAGLSPDQEPSAKQLADVAATVKAAGVKTIFSETLVDPKFAQTIAQETGATLALLDPVEGITDQSAAKDYPGVMLANLAALRTGLGCS